MRKKSFVFIIVITLLFLWGYLKPKNITEVVDLDIENYSKLRIMNGGNGYTKETDNEAIIKEVLNQLSEYTTVKWSLGATSGWGYKVDMFSKKGDMVIILVDNRSISINGVDYKVIKGNIDLRKLSNSIESK